MRRRQVGVRTHAYGIDFRYGPVQVLFDVNFHVAKGETLVLLGTNGAGKSTILRVIASLGRPSVGEQLLVCPQGSPRAAAGGRQTLSGRHLGLLGGVDLPPSVDSTRLLDHSVLHGSKRYATDGGSAFCAQCHDSIQDLWHGYPVGWDEVPQPIVQAWNRDGMVDRRAVKRPRRRSK